MRCVTINLTIPRSGPGFGEPAITIADPSPATCLVPSSLDPMLTGPGGVDPMAGAESRAHLRDPRGQLALLGERADHAATSSTPTRRRPATRS